MPFVTRQRPYAVRHGAAGARDAWGAPHDLLPICQHNSDVFVMAADGTVHVWSHDDGGLTGETWPSLAVWINDIWLGSEQ